MRIVLVLALILWAVAFFGSFIAFYLTPSSDFGFTKGADKVMAFAGGQIAAAILAMVCLLMRWGAPDPVLKRWALVPSVGLGLVFVGFVGLYFWASAIAT